MIVASVRCDVCGAEKREANHWFAGDVRGVTELIIARLVDVEKQKHMTHLCGEKCVHEWLSTKIGVLSI